jgi:hypothetical protein
MHAHLSGIKANIIICWILGILALIGMLFSFLALADIWQGEEDLSLEWSILRIGFAVITVFIGASLFTFIRVWSFLKRVHRTLN